MNDVRVVLQVFVEIHLHIVAVAREVVARKVYKHHMLGILLRVVAQVFCSLTVFLGISRAFCGARNRVDVCLECGCRLFVINYCLNPAMSFG